MVTDEIKLRIFLHIIIRSQKLMYDELVLKIGWLFNFKVIVKDRIFEMVVSQVFKPIQKSVIEVSHA